MSERQRRPGAAALIRVATLVVAVGGGALAWWGLSLTASVVRVSTIDFVVLGLGVVLVGGLWWARRVETGYWGRRPRVARRGLRERLSVAARPVPPQQGRGRPLRPPVKRRRGGGR